MMKQEIQQGIVNMLKKTLYHVTSLTEKCFTHLQSQFMLMCFDVFAAVDRCFECLMAVWTHEGPQITVCAHVTF
jgi:hypothetical protein